MSKNLAAIKNKFKRNLMDVKQLEETIQYVLEKQKINYITKSIITLGYEYVTLMELLSEEESALISDDAQLTNICSYVKEKVNQLEKIILKEYTFLQEEIHILKQMRLDIIQRVKVLQAYEELIWAYYRICQRHKSKKGIHEHDAENINWHDFCRAVLSFIFSGEEKFVQNEKIKLLLKELPVRITRQKFFDYVAKSLSTYYGSYVEYLDEMNEVLREIFYPQSINGYGDYFIEYPDMINYIEKAFDTGNLEDLEVQMENAGENLHYLLNICYYSMTIINNLLVILQGEKDYQKEYMNSEPAVGKMIRLIKDIQAIEEKVNQSEKQDELISGKIMNQLIELEGCQERLIERINSYDAVIQLIVDEYNNAVIDLGFKTGVEKIRLFELLSSDTYLVEPEKYISDFSTGKQIDNKELASKINELIAFLSESMKKMKTDLRRDRMNELLYFLPPAFESTEEIFEYICNSIEQCGDLKERMVVAEGIYTIMKSYGYEPMV